MCADYTGYGPVHRACFEYYGSCLAAVASVDDAAARALSSNGSAYVSRLRKMMGNAGASMLRCWSVVKNKDGMALGFCLIRPIQAI